MISRRCDLHAPRESPAPHARTAEARTKAGSLIVGFLAFAGSRAVMSLKVFAPTSRKDAPPELKPGSSLKRICELQNYKRCRAWAEPD